jgi:uncharacterized protein YqjF (DUF2071 family)
MLQRWSMLTFLHWSFPAGDIQCRLPAGLTADLFGGQAWVALTPFLLTGLRPPFLPPLPGISEFPETNVRTYVVGPDGERGVWFFTLESAQSLAVFGARLLYGLPYRKARMEVRSEGETVYYESSRDSAPGTVGTRIRTRIGRAIHAGSLENFLTARYRLYSEHLGALLFADVEHEPWPLHQAAVLRLEENLTAALGVAAPDGAPLVHYSPGVDVKVGMPHRVR